MNIIKAPLLLGLVLAVAGCNWTELVSVSSTGELGNDQSYDASISASGRYVAFSSDSNNLVEGDTNSSGDIFNF
jgi:hypothetical protein